MQTAAHRPMIPMSTNLFAVRLLRAMTFGARRALPGADVQLDAATAAELIRAGAGRLTDEADLGPLLDAVAAGRRPVVHDGHA